MEKELLQELKDEIELFREQTNKFIQKEISVKDFKGFSGGFGSYAQRGGEKFMLRLRMNQGVMSKDKLAFLCRVCKQHDVKKAHITTCQTIQLHDLSDVGCSIHYVRSFRSRYRMSRRRWRFST